MRLPPGVTGFGAVPAGSPPTDFAAFEAACRAAARRRGGKVMRGESCAGKVTPNFHRATLALCGEVAEVVCNARFPLAAAVRPSEGGSRELTFFDVPGLAEALAEAGGPRLATAAEWSAPLRDEHLADLAPAERRQASYWEPRTVGEVVFNFWD